MSFSHLCPSYSVFVLTVNNTVDRNRKVTGLRRRKGDLRNHVPEGEEHYRQEQEGHRTEEKGVTWGNPVPEVRDMTV